MSTYTQIFHEKNINTKKLSSVNIFQLGRLMRCLEQHFKSVRAKMLNSKDSLPMRIYFPMAKNTRLVDAREKNFSIKCIQTLSLAES